MTDISCCIGHLYSDNVAACEGEGGDSNCIISNRNVLSFNACEGDKLVAIIVEPVERAVNYLNSI